MKARFLSIAAALLMPLLAAAQTASNRANLYNEFNTYLPSGQPGGITAATLRSVLSDVVASSNNLNDVNATVSLTYTGTPITPINLPWQGSNIVVPQAAVSGPATYSQVTTSSFQVSCQYTEGGITTGNTLTSLTFNDLVHGNAMTITNCANITSLSWPAMQRCVSFNPTTLPLLTTLSLPNLASISTGGTFAPSTMNSLVTLSFPALTYCAGNFVPTAMASLTIFDFPVLSVVVGNFSPSGFGALTSFSMPSLSVVSGNLSLNIGTALTAINFPAMAYYGGTIAINIGNGNLTSVTLGANGKLKKIGGPTINISSQKLTAASVNAILNLLVTLDGTNGTTLWGSGQTLTINGGTNAAPTGQGITDKATLIARGATVTTN